MPYASLLSAMLNAELRPNSHLIRTMDVDETAAVVQLLVKKGGGPAPGIPSGLAPAQPLTKRKKDADKRTIFLRQLMVMPSMSEAVATKLVDHFGSLPSLQKALAQKKFPKIRLDDRQSVGKARVKKLAALLL